LLSQQRLVRPALSEQFPLAEHIGNDELGRLDTRASLSHPDAVDKSFVISPLLSLPSGFGAAYVGSTFTSTLCANNELTTTAERTVTSVRLSAEMKTPSQTVALQVLPKDDAREDASRAEIAGLAPGSTLQEIVRFDLREEGPHVLAVGVSYSETLGQDGHATGGRVRSFRKLYQFTAAPCLSVRTKASNLTVQSPSKDGRQVDWSKRERFALEAQLENLTEGLITVEELVFEARRPFMARSLNWDARSMGKETSEADTGKTNQHLEAPTMEPRTVTQVCYLVEESVEMAEKGIKKEVTKDGRFILGTLTIKWRGPMGDPGVLSTGWLTSRRR